MGRYNMEAKTTLNDNKFKMNSGSEKKSQPFKGQSWLVDEKDACGVGFIAYQDGRHSSKLVQQALKALGCMEHRGGCSADRDSGDGAGIMTSLPLKLFAHWFAQNNITQPESEAWGVGMIFLPQDQIQAKESKQFIEEVATAENLTVLGWRTVPVKPEVLGKQAQAFQPHIEQIIVTSNDNLTGDELERKLYIARSKVGKKLSDDFYICSFSCRTIVYKGMVRSIILGEFYQDLIDSDYESTFAVYHRRFSTNTMPKWPFAQPMRMLGHNGEINTLLGNINWMSNREKELVSRFSEASLVGWAKTEIEGLTPIVNNDNSDSYNLDSTMELLVRTGRSIPETAMILVPEAYKNQPSLTKYPEIVDFYEYHSGQQEPWDGPALLVYSDGKTVGASLDRNGLRPARYTITKDGYVVLGSEAGVIDIPEEEIVEKGRLGPGQTIVVDLQTNEVLRNWEVKQRVAKANPYGEWIKQHRQSVEPQEFGSANLIDTTELLQRQTAFGYTAEDVELIIQSMAINGKEPTFCMGDDIPLAVLSDKPRLLYEYFKQRFAQVTNPAIDPLRESLVMSLSMQLGGKGNLLNLKPEDARLLKLESPVVNDEELASIKNSDFRTIELSTLYQISTGPDGLKDAVNKLCQAATAHVEAGVEIIVLSDRGTQSIGDQYSYIPPLLAVGAVHHHLIRQGLRLRTSLIVDTAQCWSTHHFACLIGYGASAVCPYLALESVRQWWNNPKTQRLMANERIENIQLDKAQKNYRKSIEAGLLKILSKMGISLLSSYHGAQIFEALGLGVDLVDLAFAGTTSRLGGLTVADLAQEVVAFHSKAFPEIQGKKLENYGFVKYKKGGEYHMNSPEMSKALHKAVASQEYDHYELYKQHLQGRPATALRDLLDFKPDLQSVSIDEVESIESIVKRFCTGGMSLGSLSREAHETLAVAMNRIGGKSNSGEGGEDRVRFKILDDVAIDGKSPTLPHLNGLQNGDTASSAIKQVASGRFGVTPEYLMSAKQIEIKLAQGAKPGEGGQLPGKKVSPYIASLRRSKPGVTLISPPPHHDIYSIEDLAQLIFDLHQINPQAKVSVKLVAEIGIGTIAAGVAKANSDVIQISGHDGGTGASPLSSIKHAGVSWELGLTEVHRVLLENQLRDRVLLRADGGLKTGWDVIMAALMGAEEYGFGSIAMIAEGCIMARVCHMNTCPVGVATQQQHLRDRFKGIPANVVNFFYFVAEEVRQLLAKLGYSSLDQIIGRTDLLVQNSEIAITKTQGLDLSCLIDLPNVKTDRSWLQHGDVHTNEDVLDDKILADDNIASAIASHGQTIKDITIANTDRSVGGRISGTIASKYGNSGFEGEITLVFKGSAGQSFGAFNLPGMKLILSGESNDYVGKGMHGGEIIIAPSPKSKYDAATNVIIGNTCLYGATGGALYANGRAGDHCCEYMTGGVVVVLGEVGRNVGAGMTGGLGYFLDENNTFPTKVNSEIVKIQRVISSAGASQLQEMIQQHVQRTGSPKGKVILQDWENYLAKFWQLVPPSEADRPETGAEESKTLTSV